MISYEHLTASDSAREAIEYLLDSDIRFFPDKESSKYEEGYEYLGIFEASMVEKLKYSTLRSLPLFFKVRDRALLGIKIYDADKRSYDEACKIFDGKKWGCPASEILDVYQKLGYSVSHIEEGFHGIGLHLFLSRNLNVNQY